MGGIIAAGAYVPRIQLQRQAVAQAHASATPGLRALGKGERAWANWDEDSITMTVEAAPDGMFDADGAIPCQIDAGPTCFGHPIGASGLRMIYEIYLRLLGRAGERECRTPSSLALSHNLGGLLNQNVSAVAIIGLAGSQTTTRNPAKNRA